MTSLTPSEFIGSDQWKRFDKIIKGLIDANRDAMEMIGANQDPDALGRLQGQNIALRSISNQQFKDDFVGKKPVEESDEEQ